MATDIPNIYVSSQQNEAPHTSYQRLMIDGFSRTTLALGEVSLNANLHEGRYLEIGAYDKASACYFVTVIDRETGHNITLCGEKYKPILGIALEQIRETD